jgi:hypothetical protein
MEVFNDEEGNEDVANLCYGVPYRRCTLGDDALSAVCLSNKVNYHRNRVQGTLSFTYSL